MPDIPDEFEDADVLQTLGMMYAEMYQTRVELQKLNSKLTDETPEKETVECVRCGQSVAHSQRRAHLKQEHGAPPGVGIEGLFE
jgi:hypothetical protein